MDRRTDPRHPGRLARALRPYRNWVMWRVYPQFMRALAPFGDRHVLPDFLVIGAAKSGTTSLFRYLTQHPGIVPPRVKEVGYFSNQRNFPYGEKWYRAHFPSLSQMNELSATLGYPARTGEATPSMNINSYAINARALLPDAKIITIFRNPVDRTYSQYQHQRRKLPRERLSFWDALQLEAERTAADLERNLSDPDNIGEQLRRFGYTHKGKYIDQLEHWLHYFPREQMHIINFEDLASDPEGTCNQTCQFMGLPHYTLANITPRNTGRYRETMDDRCRDYLTELFRPYNRRLFTFLGEDWGWPS